MCFHIYGLKPMCLDLDVLSNQWINWIAIDIVENSVYENGSIAWSGKQCSTVGHIIRVNQLLWMTVINFKFKNLYCANHWTTLAIVRVHTVTISSNYF